MYVYLVEGTVHGYDTYDSFVVVAESHGVARRTHPGGGRTWSDTLQAWTFDSGLVYKDTSWDASIEAVTVTLLGTAAAGVVPGVVCASFNAG